MVTILQNFWTNYQPLIKDKQIFSVGRGGGQVVSVLTFNSDNPSSNPTEAYNFFSKICVCKDRKLKRPRLAHFKNKEILTSI